MPSQPSTEAVWTRLSSDLRRFIRRRVSDEHTTDDLLQETFMRVHRNIATLHDAHRVAAWVYQIARNVIHDHHRAAERATVALADAATDGEASDRLDQGRPACDWLEQMVGALPDGYREAVQLSEIEDLPQQAIADRLGLSLSGAKSRIQRGRGMLKDALEQCCQFEFDSRGNMIDYHRKPDWKACRDCDD